MWAGDFLHAQSGSPKKNIGIRGRRRLGCATQRQDGRPPRQRQNRQPKSPRHEALRHVDNIGAYSQPRRMFFAPGWGPIARSAPSPHITHAPPRSALVAQRAGVSLPATWAALKCALQAPGGLFCGSRRLPQAAQPRIALGVPAAGPTRSRAAAPFCHQGGAASCPQPMGMPSKAASDGARRLRARAKVRVNIVVRLALTRCAAEPFFNREGEVAELTSLILDDPSGLTLLLGPKNCGKSVSA
jgi:hypothetical protein